MMPAPKAMSHGLGGGAGATTLGALAGMSAANAGMAAETASAATTDNTTFFIESAPLIRSAGGFWPIPFCLPCARTRKSPRFRPGPARFDVHYGKFRPVTARRGKPKTVATAAFLGESELYRQKDAACCVNVTNSTRQAVLDPPKWVASTAAAEVFHILPDTGERFCNFAEFGFRPPPPFCGWPRAASRPAPRCRQSPGC